MHDGILSLLFVLYFVLMRFSLVIIIFLFSFTAGAQTLSENDSLITIKGSVKDTNATVGFYNLMAINKTVGKGIFGDYKGNFEITVKKGDVVSISTVGYQSVSLCFKDSAYQSEYEVVIYLKMLVYTSDVVEVTPLKTLEELQEERANIAKREVPTVTAVNVIQSPITALYIAFSEREKTKRMVADMEYQDQQDDIVREILRVYVHNDIIELDETEFEEFINFLNLNTEFLKTATDYELIVYIKDKFEHYQLIKEGY